MHLVRYIDGPSHRAFVDGVKLIRGGEPVELSTDQAERLLALGDHLFEVDGETPADHDQPADDEVVDETPDDDPVDEETTPDGGDEPQED